MYIKDAILFFKKMMFLSKCYRNKKIVKLYVKTRRYIIDRETIK